MKSKSKERPEADSPVAPKTGDQITLRRVSVRALTEAGWIAGDLHVPRFVEVAGFLNRDQDFLSLTDVFAEGRDDAMSYLALQRHAIYFFICVREEDPVEPDDLGIQDRHTVSCLMSVGSLKGSMVTKPGVRLSDRLARHRAFLSVTECKFRVRDPFSHEGFKEKHPLVFLNAEKIIGLAENGPPR